MAWAQFARNNAQVAAICDADLREARKAATIIEQKTGRRPKIYQDYRELLERNDIDVIGNATPDHWHALATINACQAGCDVYCEKPLSLTIEEGKAIEWLRGEEGPTPLRPETRRMLVTVWRDYERLTE